MKIIIFKDQHGNRYFDASSQEAVDNVCLKLVKERFQDGYYSKPKEPEKPDFDEILPESLNKIETEFTLNIYKEDLEHYQEQLKIHLDAKQATEKQDAHLAARRIIYKNRYKVYETYEIVELETP